MSGIYIHIPFCRQKCYYCDFYKTINSSLKDKFISALKNEAENRKNYLDEEMVNTIYFGGGTPSVLNEAEIEFILNFLYVNFKVSPGAEITFEANPDDLTAEYLHSLKNLGINRLSIGIQSFQDVHLKKMNRRHNAIQAHASIKNARAAGFENISADLIYGLPDLTSQQWKESLHEMFRLPVSHLSAYHLTYHQGTPFFTWLRKGTLKELGEHESVEQFHILFDEAANAGFEQYEISNFARNEMVSKHNMAYWSGEKYLGLGPSAHSYNETSRRWNVAHLEAYISGIEKNTAYFEEEQLNEQDKFNEYILTRLRTKWGISLIEIEKRFGKERAGSLKNQAEKYIQTGKMTEEQGILLLTRSGLFISDDLMTGFMII